MVIASELREGMVIRVEGEIYRVLESVSKAGAAKLGGVVRTKLRNARSGRMWEPHFRPQERLEDLELVRRPMEFLFSGGDTCTFMDLENFEQLEISKTLLGPAEKFLEAGMQLPVEFFEQEPIGFVLPEVADARVATTAPVSHAAQDSAWKEAVLDNGLTILVPLFIATGEIVRVNVNTGLYVERARSERKRSA
jgi:elongation factor P